VTTSPVKERPGKRADKAECEPLLSAAHLNIYRNNSFRVTGLPVDATPKEVSKQGDKLILMAELGQCANTNAFRPNPAPVVDEIREAIQRLKSPELRMVDELFWLWPETFGQSKEDEAIQAYVRGDGERAFDIWAERKMSPDRSAVAYHNLAVINHYMALEWELHYLTSTPSDESATTINAYWQESVRYWKQTTSDDQVWDVIKSRIRSLADERLTTGFVRRMREVLPEALGGIHAALAYKFAEQGRLSEARLHIQYIRNIDMRADQQDEIFARLLEPLQTRFAQDIKPAVDNKLDPTKRFAAAKIALSQAPAISHMLEIFYGKDSHHRTELLDEMARACAFASWWYQKATGDLDGMLAMSREALIYSTSEATRKNVQENIDLGTILLRNKTSEPFLKDLEAMMQSEESPKRRLSLVKERVMMKLATFIEKQATPNSPVIDDVRDGVALVLRGIGIDAFNKHRDLSTAHDATVLALKLGRSNAIKELLAKDKAHLDGL
jgi:hypothetical protein